MSSKAAGPAAPARRTRSFRHLPCSQSFAQTNARRKKIRCCCLTRLLSSLRKDALLWSQTFQKQAFLHWATKFKEIGNRSVRRLRGVRANKEGPARQSHSA